MFHSLFRPRYLLPLFFFIIAPSLPAQQADQNAARVRPQLVLQIGHRSLIHCLAYAPDGKLLASGSDDETIKLWSAHNGLLLHTLAAATQVTALGFTPDGQTLVSGGQNDKLRFWNVATGALQRTLTLPATPEMSRPYTDSLAFSPDGRTLAVAMANGLVSFLDVASGQWQQRLRGPKLPDAIESAQFVAFMPDGKTIVVSKGKSLTLWDFASGTLRRNLTAGADSFDAIALSPDGRIIAASNGNYDNRAFVIHLFDSTTGAAIRTLTGHKSLLVALSFTPDGKTLVSGDDDGAMKLWNVATGALVRNFAGVGESAMALAFAPDGKTLASANYAGFVGQVEKDTVKLWDVESGGLVRTMGGTDAAVAAVAFAPDGNSFATSGHDHSVRLWDAHTGNLVRTFSGHDFYVNALAFAPDGDTLASGSWDGTARVWNTHTGALLHALSAREDKDEAHLYWVNAVAFAPDGKTLATASRDDSGPRTRETSDRGVIKLWDAKSGALLRTLQEPYGWAEAVAFSPDGKTLVSESSNKAIRVWDAASGRLLRSMWEENNWLAPPDTTGGSMISSYGEGMAHSWDHKLLALAEGGAIVITDKKTNKPVLTLQAQTAGVSVLVFTPDNKMLAGGAADGTIRFWNVATGAVARTFKETTDPIEAVAFSPDGKTLVSRNAKKRLHFWDLSSGAFQCTLPEPDQTGSGVYKMGATLAFAPDGQTLFSGQTNGTVHLWDINTGVMRQALPGQGHQILGLATSRDGSMVASGGGDNSITLWDARSGKPRGALAGHDGAVQSVCFAPDGKTLVSGSDDNTIKVWSVADKRLLATLLTLPEVGEEVKARAKGMIIISEKGVEGGADEWFVTVPEGYFDGSANAARYVRWRVNGAIFPAERYYRRFRRPDLVRRALQGEKIDDVAMTEQDVPPTARFVRFAYTGTQPNAVQLTLRVQSRHPLPADPRHALVVLINGRPLSPEQPLERVANQPGAIVPGAAVPGAATDSPVPLSDKPIILSEKPIILSEKLIGAANSDAARYRASGDYTFTVPLPLGTPDVRLRAIAFDDSELGSDAAELLLRNTRAQATPGNLYVLCVGLSRYKNGQDLVAGRPPAAGQPANLTYPALDAQAMAARLQRETKPLYDKVEVRTLANEQATMAGVRDGLKWLQGQTRPGQVDTAIVFLSGHGFSDAQGRYYFPTYEFDAAHYQDTSLSGALLHDELGGKLRAKNVFLFVDTCHSGALANARSADLSYEVQESGVYLLASSGGTQRSFESPAWGHGAFTKALLTALDDKTQARQGLIYFDALTYTVPSHLARLMQAAGLSLNAEEPVVPLEGRRLDEPVVRVRP